ncbi:MAG: rhomboid family intramembrane serine protease [Blautia sp.]
MNTLMILVNILVFLMTELTGSSLDGRHLVSWGAVYTPLLETEHEYYRLFTCMFLHFGLSHLGNNMLVLLFMGDALERAVGKVRYLLIYLMGGLGASCVSGYIEIKKEATVISAGASGAVFAVIGSLIYIVIRKKGKLENFTARQLIFLAFLTLYHGYASAGVDNAAHVGGLLCGFFLGILLYWGRGKDPHHRKKSGNRKNQTESSSFSRC